MYAKDIDIKTGNYFKVFQKLNQPASKMGLQANEEMTKYMIIMKTTYIMEVHKQIIIKNVEFKKMETFVH